MKLTQTRAIKGEKVKKVKLSTALLNPSSPHSGLYAPEKLPILDECFWKECHKLSYKKLALKVIKSFKFDIDESIIKKALKKYKDFDDAKTPAIFKKLQKNLYINELYHGPTKAFKDMALSPFGEILNHLAKAKKEKFLIICATSGDTGPATLKSFENSKHIKVVCLYPDGGTSEVQKLQMVTLGAKNLKVFGINGNFDDAQRTLKTLLTNDEFKNELKNNNLKLSAANSVNFGRILFQIIYHIYAYAKLLKAKKIKDNETFDIIVPSGNFGNALGAYYAKKMGAKIGKIKIVSNENNILSDFFNTGTYDLRDRELLKTISPAMDILISSNIERLLFDKFGAVRTNELMQDLQKHKFYTLTDDELKAIQADFQADFCTDKKCKKFIQKWLKDGVAIDPHTATCFKMVDKKRLNVITSTAHWIKFVPSMISASKKDIKGTDKAQMIQFAQSVNQNVPSEVLKLFDSKIIHKEILDQDQIKDKILEWVRK